MPRVCTVCTHPKRAEIDKLLASGECVKRDTARRYGLDKSAICRHGDRHLDPALIEAHERLVASERRSSVLTARQVVLDLVHDIRGIAESMKINGKVHYAKDFLEVADRLVRANEQYGKITKELGNDQINALFVNLGVRGEDELKSRLALVSGSENLSLEAVVDSACEAIETAGRKDPAVYLTAMRRLERASVALEANGNGHREGD